MPRKKKSPAAMTVLRETGVTQIEEPFLKLQTELDTAEAATDIVDSLSVFARVVKFAGLVASCDAAGVQVPPLVRESIPTLPQVVDEYVRLNAIKNETERQVEILKDYLKDQLDA